ncbi:hypothetical protein ACNHUS_07215 [Actinomycetes bacterium M1A6_2h]
MHVVLGISASDAEVTAALVDPQFPQLGPVDERVTPLRDESVVGEVVAAAISVMSLRAQRDGIDVQSTSVSYSTVAEHQSIVTAMKLHRMTEVSLVEVSDLDDDYPTAVAAALWGSDGDRVLDVAPPPVAGPKPTAGSSRGGIVVAAVGIAAAIVVGGIAVWAVAGAVTPNNAGVSSATPTSAPSPTSAPGPIVTTTVPLLPPPTVTTEPGAVDGTESTPDEATLTEPYSEPGYVEQPNVAQVPSAEAPSSRGAVQSARSQTATASTRVTSRPNGGGSNGGGSNPGGSTATQAPVSSEDTPAPTQPDVPTVGPDPVPVDGQ